jgi:hypothetical protein
MPPHHDADPSMFNDVELIGATYTEDGATIYAIVHSEYHGWEHLGQCSSGAWTDQCWYNGLTLAVSTDAGSSYQHSVAPPLHLIASSPLQYEKDLGPRGIFHPSNIIKGADGYYYAMIRRVTLAPLASDEQWSCLMRTSDLSDPDAWRFWDGAMFEGLFVNPYTDPISNADDHDCSPIDRHDIADMTESITYNEYLEQYILTGTSTYGDKHGFFVSYSDDLVHWTHRELLLDSDLPWTVSNASDPYYAYPSLLDPASTSRNFETIGKTAYVYYTRNNRSSGDLDRDMLRVPVEFFRR